VCITGDEIFAQRRFGWFAEEEGKPVDVAARAKAAGFQLEWE